MPHIHTEPGQHDATASAFIVRLDGDEPKLLVHMHKKLGKLLQPGGHVELSENPWKAALHEVIEETGYQLEQLRVLQPRERLRQLTGSLLHPVPVCQNTHLFKKDSGHFHSDTSYALLAEGEPLEQPAKGESTDLRWLTKQQLEGKLDVEISPNACEIGLYVLSVCVTKWEAVPLSSFSTEL